MSGPGRQVEGSIITDPLLRAELDRHGWANAGRVHPDVVADAIQLARRELPADRAALHFSTASPDAGYRRRVSAGLGEILAPSLATLLRRARFVFGVLVAQRPGPGTGMGFHHDLSFVEHEAGQAVVAWVPLTDVSEASGTLAVLTGSHDDVRSPRGTPTFPSPFRDVDADALRDRFETVEAPAGSIVLMDPRLAHLSTDNRGDRERITAICTFVIRDEPLVHHYRWPDGSVERFHVDPDFYTRFDLHRPPTSERSLGVVEVDFPALDRDDVLRRYPHRARILP